MDRHRSFFGYANDTDRNMFEWFNAHPEQLNFSNKYQSATAEIGENRFQCILKSLLSSTLGCNPASPPTGVSGDVLLVDFGGGHGRTPRDVRRQVSDLSGRLIVHDLPKVIEGQETVDGVEAIAYFLTPQPVKGDYSKSELKITGSLD